MPIYITSMVEMTLGVCICCMPAMSQITRTALPGAFERLRSGLSSRFGRSNKSKSTLSQGSHKGSLHHHFGNGFVKFKGGDTTITEYELQGHDHAVSTFIGGGNPRSIKEDGIHLKHELRQESYHSVTDLNEDGSRMGFSNDDIV